MLISDSLECDILVVGGGIAGLVSAKKASDMGKRVILLINDNFGSGASYFPLKGTLGIQATLNENDKEKFYEDIARLGDGVENPDMINTYINEIDDSIYNLNEIGFEPWLRQDNRPACFAKYSRKIYLINEWNKSRLKGREIFNRIANIEILEKTTLVQLVKKDGRVIGGVAERDGKFLSISTGVVVMATGGVAGVYEHNLYPTNVYGSGHIILMDIGAKAQNMEFIQFIPAFIKPVYNTLFGEHTLKYCTGMYDLEDNLICEGVERERLWIERSGYAPFSSDFKSHLIDLKMFQEMKRNGKGVKLKFSKSLYENKEEFYVVFLKWLRETMGIDMCRDEIIIAPFAHSCNGGIRVNIDGETGISGVYAIGELSSGIEGANRLGGNSVGGALVFAKRAINSAVKYLESIKFQKDEKYMEKEFEKWLKIVLAEDREKELTYTEAKKIIAKIISETGSIVRDGKKIEESLKQLDEIRGKILIKDNLKKGVDIYFRIETIKMLLNAMLAREESRGAHYREDFPTRDKKLYKVLISRENGKFKIEKILV